MFYNRKEKVFRLVNNKKTIFTYKKEMFAVLILSLSFFLFFAFISYNPYDPSWFYFASDVEKVTNWSGWFGANFAAFFFYYLGSAAYIFLFILFFLAFLLFFKKPLKPQWDRFLALIVLLFAACTLLRFFHLDFTNSFPGGWLGSVTYNFLEPYLGSSGLLVFLIMLLWICTTIILRFSFFSSFVFIAKIFKNVFSYLFSFIWAVLKKASFWIFKFFKSIFRRIKALRSKDDVSGQGSDSNSDLSPIPQYKFPEGKSGSFDYPQDGENNFLSSLKGIAENSPAYADFKSAETYFDSLRSLPSTTPRTGFDRVQDQGEWDGRILNLFENKKTFVNFKPYQIFNKNIFLLPNSVLQQNIFKNQMLLELTQEIVPEQTENKKNLIKYDLPDLEMFQEEAFNSWNKEAIEKECHARGEKLEEKLHRFGIGGSVTAIRPGPVVTLFEFKPEIDSKISKIMSLEDDLAMALTAMSIRIIAPIPGRSVVGFEISNQTRQFVFLSDLLLSEEFKNFEGKLPVALGVDIVGRPVIEDLVYMPHLLVAGSTGSGKSVGLNAVLIGFLCKFRPDQLKLILIDPKRLEFAPYADVPHLLFPIVTNPRQAPPVLKWVVQEMEDRYEKMASAGVRNIVEYQKLYELKSKREELNLTKMPFIVLMIDELADLMMVAGKEVETQIARIAQMARAAGIHMIVATQRPSVDVVTGLIKVNFPSRVAYRVSSKIDSRTIIDAPGAEKLLGRGDMLYLNSSSSDLKRIHGAYVSDKQVEKLASFLRDQQKAEYLDLNEELRKVENLQDFDLQDDLYDEIVEYIKQRDEISISMIQRQYRIGFNRSARIIERLELDGLIAPSQGSKPRKVLR